MEAEKLNKLRLNVMDAGSSIVASNRAELLELVTYTESLIVRVAEPPAGVPRFYGLAIGIRNAPANHVIYHERLHLLEWLDFIDQLTERLPPPPPAPEPETAE